MTRKDYSVTYIPPEGYSSRRARRRAESTRSHGASRFTGVGRHCRVTDAVIEMHLAAQLEPVAPLDTRLDEPLEADFSDEYDLQDTPSFENHVDDELDVAPGGTSTLAVVPGAAPAGAASSSHAAFSSRPEPDADFDEREWLSQADAEAAEHDTEDVGFAGALARHFDDVPAGYLPAEDFFSESEADLTERRRRRKRRRFNLVAVVLVLILVVGGAGFFLHRELNKPDPDYVGSGQGQVDVSIEQGWTTRQIAAHLQDRGVVMDASTFVKKVGASSPTPVFQPGEYKLRKEMSSDAAIKMLTDREAVTYFALPANVRLDAALQAIAEGTDIPRATLEELANDPERFGLPEEAKNIEGYLHPGDYRFPLKTKPEQVLQTLIDKTKEELKKNGVTDPAEQYRVLKIASIIAGEAPRDDYPRVAGIIENRLHKDNRETGGYLQLDSTVAYGLDKTTVHLTQSELEDKKNKYNTYTHQGLPPTPIGSPGPVAIAGAAKPDESGDYYWVTVNLTTGETKYSDNLEQHERYVREYRKWCADHPDECNA